MISGVITHVVLMFLALGLGFILLTLPGLRLLPKPGCTTVNGVTTLSDVERACRQSGLADWELVAYAQRLVSDKFSYSRRNPWDTPERAFRRGLGYCQQQALAMKEVCDRLGIKAQLVYATRARFPKKTIHGVAEGERVSGHTWLRVSLNGEERDVDTTNRTNEPGRVHFTLLSPARESPTTLLPIFHLSSVLLNAWRDWRATGFRA